MRRLLLPSLFALALAGAVVSAPLLPARDEDPHLPCATCAGADPCKACKNCSSCKHCATNGGTCGVCKR